MGIDKSQFSIIWTAVGYWLQKKGMKIYDLAPYSDLTSRQIENGLVNKNEWITTEFVHTCVDRFGLTHARARSFEELTDILTDEECIQLLIAPLTPPLNNPTIW